MVRILRAFDPLVFKTLQRGNPPGQTFAQKMSGDKDVEGLAALVPGRQAAKRAVAGSRWNKSKVPRQ